MAKFEAHTLESSEVDAVSFFDKEGNLASVALMTPSGASVVMPGSFFASLVAQVTMVVKEKNAEATKAREEAAAALAAEDAKHAPQNPHQLITEDELTSRCVKCGIGETIVSQLVRSLEDRYDGMQFTECLGSPEAAKAAFEAERAKRESKMKAWEIEMEATLEAQRAADLKQLEADKAFEAPKPKEE